MDTQRIAPRWFRITDVPIPDAHAQIWVESGNYPGVIPDGYVAVIRKGDMGAWPALLRLSWLTEVPHDDPTARKPITNAAELAAAYGLAWPADACRHCGGKLIDGRCQGADGCDDPTCSRACHASEADAR